jgi:hypothetical protein
MSVLVSAETVFYLADLTVVPLTLTLSQGENNLSIQQKPMESSKQFKTIDSRSSSDR